MHAFAFLEKAEKYADKPVVVLTGGETFLVRRSLAALRNVVLGEGDDDFGFTRFEGVLASLSDVLDELATAPLLGGRRLVVVDDADPFVTRYRAALERYADAPSSRGVLVLVVKSLPANTRLAKKVALVGVCVECQTPRAGELPAWAVRWAQATYGKKLARQAAELLVELVGSDLGMLEGELDKLAVYAGDAVAITLDDVETLTGGWVVETRWKLLDAAAEGRTGDALAMLDRLLVSGEAPVGLLATLAWQLRMLAQAARLAQRGTPLRTALSRVGVKPFAAARAEAQLRRLGRARANRLFDWLLEADLELKGGSSLPPRTVLEKLLVRLSSKQTVTH